MPPNTIQTYIVLVNIQVKGVLGKFICLMKIISSEYLLAPPSHYSIDVLS